MSGAEVAGLAADARRPRVTEVEQHGIDTIPDAERASRPFDLFRIQFGGANTFATVILGTFPCCSACRWARRWRRRCWGWSSGR
jgi:hypothetical protein